MRPLLQRQLRRAGLSDESPPTAEQWQQFLRTVERTYVEAEQDRYTIERSLAISSEEMRQLYEDLKRSEQRHRILFDASPHPIWVFEPDTLRILAINEAFVTVFGYSRDEAMAMTVAELKAPEQLAEMVAEVHALEPDRTQYVGVRRYVRKNDEPLEVEITAHATRLEDRIVILAVGVDVTQSRRLEDQLRQAQKMEAIGQLAGGIAHDFNNILGTILGNAELVRDELGDGHALGEDIREIQTAAERAAGLTRQLLAFSRKQRREVTVFSPNNVIDNLNRMLARLLPETIELVTSMRSRSMIEADVGQIEQVVMNLVLNARDAMPDGGRLAIETSEAEIDDLLAAQLDARPGRYVVIAVSDTGTGIDAATQARIFDPFFTTKPVGKGTGLGLSTVFGIVKQSHGAVGVYSEPNRGSTFRVYLPCTDTATEHEPPPLVARGAGSGTVLVVEDDRQLRASILRHLAALGFSILEAPSGAGALEVLRGGSHVDLVLTDLVMPGVDGRSLARAVRTERPATRVLFMSGYTEHSTIVTSPDDTFEHFIEKPFSGRALAAAIHEALACPRCPVR